MTPAPGILNYLILSLLVLLSVAFAGLFVVLTVRANRRDRAEPQPAEQPLHISLPAIEQPDHIFTAGARVVWGGAVQPRFAANMRDKYGAGPFTIAVVKDADHHSVGHRQLVQLAEVDTDWISGAYLERV